MKLFLFPIFILLVTSSYKKADVPKEILISECNYIESQMFAMIAIRIKVIENKYHSIKIKQYLKKSLTYLPLKPIINFKPLKT